MAVCPYLSGIRFDTAGAFIGVQKVECLGPECELWDSINARCGTKVSDTIRNNNDNETNTLITLLEKVLGTVSEKDEAPTGESLLTISNHTHDSHYHPTIHECSEIPADCGRATAFGGDATTLIGEFYTNQDLDNNGKIYGKDFKIQENAEKPPALRGLEGSPDWVEPSTHMNWGDYLNE